jgi:hypothetical protein
MSIIRGRAVGAPTSVPQQHALWIAPGLSATRKLPCNRVREVIEANRRGTWTINAVTGKVKYWHWTLVRVTRLIKSEVPGLDFSGNPIYQELTVESVTSITGKREMLRFTKREINHGMATLLEALGNS